MNPTVSIVGRPNVGKSTFFNRLIGEREAIVHDAEGVTRDRHYGDAFWNGVNFTVIDTGGYLPDDVDVIITGVREQVHIAIEESDVILFVVDTVTGIHPIDQAVADLLRRQEKPVIVVANKADNEQRILNATEFYALGFDEIYPVSSISGSGSGDLLDAIVSQLPEPDEEKEKDHRPKLAFVGRPNVGKSSIVNALLRSDRCIVTDVPGTTRDSIDSLLIYGEKEWILVDTAGLRKRAKVKENIEFYSNVRTDRALRQSDVAVLIIDAMQGFEVQDKRILREAERFNKGILIVLNKWDLVPDKDTHVVKEFQEYIYSQVPTMRYVPILTTSALSRQRVEKILDYSEMILQERQRKIPTSELNTYIESILKERPLPIKRGHRLKIKYATQVKSNPPVFKFFMNHPEELPPNYRRFIEKKLREAYGFTGVPLTLIFRQK